MLYQCGRLPVGGASPPCTWLFIEKSARLFLSGRESAHGNAEVTFESRAYHLMGIEDDEGCLVDNNIPAASDCDLTALLLFPWEGLKGFPIRAVFHRLCVFSDLCILPSSWVLLRVFVSVKFWVHIGVEEARSIIVERHSGTRPTDWPNTPNHET